MRELSMTRNLVAIVSERAVGQRVLRVTLEVGRLSGMLHIVEIEGRGVCSACGAEPVMTAPLGRCPVCREPSLRISAGTELNIKDMEVESCV